MNMKILDTGRIKFVRVTVALDIPVEEQDDEAAEHEALDILANEMPKGYEQSVKRIEIVRECDL